MLNPLKVKRVNLSFLDLFEIPRDRIADSLSVLRSPDKYYSFVSQRGDRPGRIIIPKFGSFRPGLSGNLPTDKTRPKPDEFWYNLYGFYDELSGLLTKQLPCFPFIPIVHAYLPNKNRAYSLDLAGLPETMRSLSEKRGKLSVSTYFFPLGYAISRTGVYLESEVGFESEDIALLVSEPGKHLRATVSGPKNGGKGPIHDDFLFSIIDEKQRSLYQAMVGDQGPTFLRSQGKYSVVDLVEVSREPDLTVDRDVLSLLTRSPLGEDTGRAFTVVSHEDRLNILTPGTALLRLSKPEPEPDDDFRRAYRRRVRNVAMLLLIQRSLFSRAMGVSARELIEVIKSGNPVKQFLGFFAPPKVQDSFSFLHYLTAHEPAFGKHHSVMELYRAMRPLIDGEGTITKSTGNMVTCLNDIKGQIDQSGKMASEIFSTILNELLPRIPI